MQNATKIISNQPNFWMLHCLGWAAYVVIFAFDNILFEQKVDSGFYVLFPLFLSASMAFFLTLPLRYLYRRCWALSPKKLIVIITLSSLVVALIWTPYKNVVMLSLGKGISIYAMIKNMQSSGTSPWFMLNALSYSFFMVLVWSSLYFGINYHYRLMKEKQLHIDAVRLSHQAQIKMLRYQINPHFLFNTLNAVSTLVLKQNTNKANDMIIRLSTFLRFSLDNDPEKKVPLYEEIKATMLYLDIEKTRFEERLSVDLQISERAEVLLVPSLLLQPIIENSIKYAIAKMNDGGVICIQANVVYKQLIMVISDNGPGKVDVPEIQNIHSHSHRGVGLKNIKDRLNVLYPNNHSFTIQTEPKVGFKVSISIPTELA